MNNHQPPHKMRSSDIASSLRRQITQQDIYLNGDRLPSGYELSAHFGVTRATVLRAFRILEKEQLVKIRHGSGTYVVSSKSQDFHKNIDETTPLEMIDARFAIEPHICRLVVMKARPNDLLYMEQLLDKMEHHVHDPIQFSKIDSTFHEHLTKITGNPLLIKIMSQIVKVRDQKQWARMRQLTLNQKSIQMYNEQHRTIVEMIKARNAEAAAHAMQNHLVEARNALTTAVST